MPKKALFIHGGWQMHEPEQCAALFADLLRKEGFDAELSPTLDSLLDCDRLDSIDLFVPAWTMGELSPEQETNLCRAVAKGAGLGGWHGGMGDAFRSSSEYQFMVGGQFVAHPGKIKEYEVNIVDRDSEITRGLGDFMVRTEQYYMHVDPSNHLLAATTMSGDLSGCDWVRDCVMPVAWTRRYGRGKVFYSSLGHAAADFDVTETREIVRRGLLWAAR